MKKFFDELNEATTVGPPPAYPDKGGISSDDDLPTGTTVFGDKMVPVVVPNRLTGSTVKYVPADDLKQEWNYDEFDNSAAMGSVKAYSETLQGLERILGDRLFKHTDARKVRMQKDKWAARSGEKDGGVKQTAKTQDDNPSHMELTGDGELNKMGGKKPESNDYWREVPMKNKPDDIMERINNYLGEPEEQINEDVADKDDRKGLSNAIIKGKTVKLKLDSLDGVELNIASKGDDVKVWYKRSQDLTLTLVDICDSLGYEFDVSKSGSETTFKITK
jgi:hypothetical protein